MFLVAYLSSIHAVVPTSIRKGLRRRNGVIDGIQELLSRATELLQELARNPGEIWGQFGTVLFSYLWKVRWGWKGTVTTLRKGECFLPRATCKILGLFALI